MGSQLPPEGNIMGDTWTWLVFAFPLLWCVFQMLLLNWRQYLRKIGASLFCFIFNQSWNFIQPTRIANIIHETWGTYFALKSDNLTASLSPCLLSVVSLVPLNPEFSGARHSLTHWSEDLQLDAALTALCAAPRWRAHHQSCCVCASVFFAVRDTRERGRRPEAAGGVHKDMLCLHIATAHSLPWRDWER